MVLQLWGNTCDVSCGRQRCRRNLQARLLYRVRPSHRVRQGHIMGDLYIRRRHDRLRAVVALSWHRDYGLRREFRVGLRRSICTGIASIEGRQVFGRLVVNHLGAIEGRCRDDLRLQREQVRQSDQRCSRGDVIQSGLEEAVPGKRETDENVIPEWSWGRSQRQGRKLSREEKIAQVLDEQSGPGRQIDQQPRNGRGLGDFDGWPDGGHFLIVDAVRRFRIAGRAYRNVDSRGKTQMLTRAWADG